MATRLEIKCSYGSRCVFSHNLTSAQNVPNSTAGTRIQAQQIITQQNVTSAQSVQNITPGTNEATQKRTQQDFQQNPTSKSTVVGNQNNSEIMININNMAMKMNQMLTQMTNLMVNMNQQF